MISLQALAWYTDTVSEATPVCTTSSYLPPPSSYSAPCISLRSPRAVTRPAHCDAAERELVCERGARTALGEGPGIRSPLLHSHRDNGCPQNWLNFLFSPPHSPVHSTRSGHDGDVKYFPVITSIVSTHVWEVCRCVTCCSGLITVSHLMVTTWDTNTASHHHHTQQWSREF